MPSRYEPCGLSQLYSLRYGTVPIVRKTGGLADTVVGYTPSALRVARHWVYIYGYQLSFTVDRSVAGPFGLQEKTDWQRLIKAGMEQDLSWTRSASTYIQLFEELVAGESQRT